MLHSSTLMLFALFPYLEEEKKNRKKINKSKSLKFDMLKININRDIECTKTFMTRVLSRSVGYGKKTTF